MRSQVMKLVQQEVVMAITKIIPAWNFTSSPGTDIANMPRLFVYGINKYGEHLIAKAILNQVGSLEMHSSIFSYATQGDYLGVRWELSLSGTDDGAAYDASLYFSSLESLKYNMTISPLSNTFSPSAINSTLTIVEDL